MSDRTPHYYECSETIALLFPYLDRELDAVEQAKVRHHLDQCGDCSRLFRFEAAMLTLVGERLARTTAPAELRTRIHELSRRTLTGG
jgi:mycothiol system anti-sigma-R factor